MNILGGDEVNVRISNDHVVLATEEFLPRRTNSSTRAFLMTPEQADELALELIRQAAVSRLEAPALRGANARDDIAREGL